MSPRERKLVINVGLGILGALAYAALEGAKRRAARAGVVWRELLWRMRDAIR